MPVPNQPAAIKVLWYARWHSWPWSAPLPKYGGSCVIGTMASAFITTDGVTISVTARNATSKVCASGWFMQSVPVRFHRYAVESRRNASTPRLASRNIASAISPNTAGLLQFKSH